MTECDKPMTLDEIIEALQHYRDSDEIVFGLSDDCIEGLRLATAALAERDAEIERLREALKNKTGVFKGVEEPPNKIEED